LEKTPTAVLASHCTSSYGMQAALFRNSCGVQDVTDGRGKNLRHRIQLITRFCEMMGVKYSAPDKHTGGISLLDRNVWQSRRVNIFRNLFRAYFYNTHNFAIFFLLIVKRNQPRN
jgi:hypothetical protein